jgi:FkbM family methyltransferase
MKIFEIIAIVFFDLIDKFFHQRRIILTLKKNISQLNNFIDVGAHKGNYTDLILNNFKPKKILMFEPQDRIFNYLKKKYNENKNIYLFNTALSSKNESAKFNLNRHNLTSSLSNLDQNNSYIKLKAKLFGTTSQGMIVDIKTIQTKTLFTILEKENLEAIDLLKIDTEGHELQVLQGMSGKINMVKYMLIEFHNDEIYVSYDPKKLHKFLISNNFKLIKRFKFPFTTWEDRLYVNDNFN